MKSSVAFIDFCIITFVCFGYTFAETNLQRCGFGKENVDQILNCSRSGDRLLQITVGGYWEWPENFMEECVDIIPNFFFLNLTDRIMVPREQVSKSQLPKCCPLKKAYNSLLHTCETKKHVNQTYVDRTALQIALPNGRVTIDYEIHGTIDLMWYVQDTEYILSRRKNFDAISRTTVIPDGAWAERDCTDKIEIHEEVGCLKECCREGQRFRNGYENSEGYRSGLNTSRWMHVSNSTDPYMVNYNRSCRTDYITSDEKYAFSIESKATYTFYINYDEVSPKKGEERDTYWMEYNETEILNRKPSYIYKRSKMADSEEKFAFTFYAFILSCVFLTLTIAIYILINETRKLFGKILTLYCSTMLLQSITLACSASYSLPTDTECKTIAFAIILFGVAGFSWSNILCWNIWNKFGSTRSLETSSRKSKDIMKISLFICYGWGLPITITLIIYIFYHFDDILPEVIQPHLAINKCFFETMINNYAKTLFFNLPLLTMEIANIVLYVKTLLYCCRVKHEINNYAKTLFFNLPLLTMEIANIVLYVKTLLYCCRVKHEINKRKEVMLNEKGTKLQKEKECAGLILKLSIIMGISLIFEAVSGFIDMRSMGGVAKYVELIWDMINALQGVFIFLIFICKKRILRDLVNKLPLFLSQISSLSTSSKLSQTHSGIPLHIVEK